MLDTAPQNPNAAFASAVPFLMLSGNLAVAWQLGRSALAAEAELAKGEDAAFMTQKIDTALFYAQNILADCAAAATDHFRAPVARRLYRHLPALGHRTHDVHASSGRRGGISRTGVGCREAPASLRAQPLPALDHTLWRTQDTILAAGIAPD